MLKVKILKNDVKIPVKQKEGDAGFDVFSLETVELKPMEKHIFGLGFAVEFPLGYVLMVNEKSGMAINNGIMTIANIIDSGYRGEIHAILFNLSDVTINITIGQKIAQLLLLNCYTGKKLEVVDALSKSERGEAGFGSTGLK